MTRSFDRASLLPSDKVIPHIVPDVLYPAIAGKLLDGTTSHSGNYGTSQSDSRKYYYTDIKGSRPIRDPRIGAYFGSQRHKFKSLQLLQQETATHGKNVYSVDGREWVRVVCNELSTSYDENGHYIMGNNVTAGSFMEVVGYFLDANFLNEQHSADRNLTVQVNGSSAVAFNDYTATVGSPLGGRYVDEAVLINIDLPTENSASLGINTLRINFVTGSYPRPAGIELIAQDTTSSTTRNQIQIPSQTVVSFGSKFSLSASTPHYHPFNTKSDGTAWTSPTSGTNNANSSAGWPSVIDTATSLGLAKWVSGTNYYRPYNGGRVVKWVDENGEIKTSVTVMPPNAKSIGDSGTLTNGTAKSNGSAPNDNFRPTFEAHTSSVDEDLLSEVAKSYYSREFGNGAANGGTGSGTQADASMLSGTADIIGYVMDDGLTSFAGDTVEVGNSSQPFLVRANQWSSDFYFTFIGTGISVVSGNTPAINKYADNLPYGTHIIHAKGDSGNSNFDLLLDGVEIISNNTSDAYHTFQELTYHQPKMPPIPEDCVILADYMLMADFVTQTDNTSDLLLSKGVRLLSSSRDVTYDSAAAISGAVSDVGYLAGLQGIQSGNTMSAKLPFFGSNVIVGVYDKSQSHTMDMNSSTNVTKALIDGPHVRNDKLRYNGSALNLGVNVVTTNMITGGYPYNSTEIVTPIHTSHHYKTFETPYLKELIGGDRNMEQTHLICSADGKTWDEVTRDTSYIGKCVLSANNDDDVDSGTTTIIMTEWRSTPSGEDNPNFNKDFAISYDRVICLVDGQYEIYVQTLSNASNCADIRKNGTTIAKSNKAAADGGISTTVKISLERGDFIQVVGDWYQNEIYNNYTITRL